MLPETRNRKRNEKQGTEWETKFGGFAYKKLGERKKQQYWTRGQSWQFGGRVVHSRRK